MSTAGRVGGRGCISAMLECFLLRNGAMCLATVYMSTDSLLDLVFIGNTGFKITA